MSSQSVTLTDRQLETLKKIAIAMQSQWRYSVPPATSFHGGHIKQLQQKGLVKLSPCQMYIDKKHPYSGKGISLTEAGTQLIHSLKPEQTQ